jgi:chemotaxis protein methyltransferase CheR
MEGYEIGIVETRNIIRTLLEVHNYDFSSFALTSFKRRIERSMLLNNMSNPETLVTRLREEKNFINKFLLDIAIESTEMFRDPSLWRWLRDEFFPQQINKNYRFKIWLPQCISGDELFSLIIVLKECGCLSNAKILASALSDEFISKIKEGILNFKKVDTSNENYKRYQGTSNLTDYYNLTNGKVLRDQSLLDNIEFTKYNVISDPPLKDIKMIFFRNFMISYNPTLQSTVLNKLYDSLSFNGHLIIGAKESIENSSRSKDFILVNENESVYRKKS